MVIIKDMKVPTSCGACKMSGTDVCKTWMKSKNLAVRHPDCPIQDQVTCKECVYSLSDPDYYMVRCCKHNALYSPDGYCQHGRRK